MVILVWESDPRAVGSSVCDNEGNCERAFFAAAGSIADSNVGDELDRRISPGASGAMVGFGGVMVDGPSGERAGVFVGMDERISDFVANGAGLFVCQI